VVRPFGPGVSLAGYKRSGRPLRPISKNYSDFILIVNACHERAGYCSRAPTGFLESRTATCPLTVATSTQAPLPTLRLALRHWRSRASRLVRSMSSPDLRKLRADYAISTLVYYVHMTG
jgi:hypothetical protein